MLSMKDNIGGYLKTQITNWKYIQAQIPNLCMLHVFHQKTQIPKNKSHFVGAQKIILIVTSFFVSSLDMIPVIHAVMQLIFNDVKELIHFIT